MAEETSTQAGQVTGHADVVTTIAAAEPLGPARPMDALLIAPCTGNTLAKLANGVTDSAVTMAAKAHLRNGRPLVIAISTNDGLSGSAENVRQATEPEECVLRTIRAGRRGKKALLTQGDSA
ncbi:MAG: flavoprotein [Oscillospiraceae bacterium]